MVEILRDICLQKELVWTELNWTELPAFNTKGRSCCAPGLVHSISAIVYFRKSRWNREIMSRVQSENVDRSGLLHTMLSNADPLHACGDAKSTCLWEMQTGISDIFYSKRSNQEARNDPVHKMESRLAHKSFLVFQIQDDGLTKKIFEDSYTKTHRVYINPQGDLSEIKRREFNVVLIRCSA